MKEKYLDMWYGDSPRDADKIDIFFSDLDCIYRGNIYKTGELLGIIPQKRRRRLKKCSRSLYLIGLNPPAGRMEETNHDKRRNEKGR